MADDPQPTPRSLKALLEIQASGKLKAFQARLAKLSIRDREIANADPAGTR
jgi:hypothetical protein